MFTYESNACQNKRRPDDIASVAQGLTQLADMLTGLGRLDEALDASQAATLLYQHLLGAPSSTFHNNTRHEVPQCKCDPPESIPETIQDRVLPSIDETRARNHSQKLGIWKKGHKWPSNILDINSVAHIFKILRPSAANDC
ncbi:hypothetical protein RSAG8_03745, partial [Rhizoctonia solani AG-8 WAC10335]